MTSDAIKALRQASNRNLPAYVISEFRGLIELAAIRKFEAAEFDKDGLVVITERDVAA